jgi:hypothetical protein
VAVLTTSSKHGVSGSLGTETYLEMDVPQPDRFSPFERSHMISVFKTAHRCFATFMEIWAAVRAAFRRSSNPIVETKHVQRRLKETKYKKR